MLSNSQVKVQNVGSCSEYCYHGSERQEGLSAEALESSCEEGRACERGVCLEESC